MGYDKQIHEQMRKTLSSVRTTEKYGFVVDREGFVTHPEDLVDFRGS